MDILRERGIVSAKEYDQLLKRAKTEQAQLIEHAEQQQVTILENVRQGQTEMLEKVKAEHELAERKPNGSNFRWKDGLNFETDDKNFKTKLGGRIYVDFANYSSDKRIQNEFQGKNIEGTGTELRSARLEAEGDFYEDFFFKIQYDFATGKAVAKDVYMGVQNIPYVGAATIGHQKEPFSLEELTSSRYITFMERGLPNVFAPSRNTGVKLGGAVLDKRMTWAVGGFEDTDDFAQTFANWPDWNITGRLTGLPWYAGEDKLIHLGFSYTHQFRDDEKNPLDYRQRPESHITDARLVDTGNIPLNGADIVDPEIALVYGAFSVQAEYMSSFVNGRNETPNFWGMYVYGSYFITGEHRNYSRASGALSRIKPNCNFSIKERTWGAWEVAARYSALDLNSKSFRGGLEQDFTFGLNWYLNPYARWMFNYIYAFIQDRDNSLALNDDYSNIVQTRFQVDF